jgi:hypothetical protein
LNSRPPGNSPIIQWPPRVGGAGLSPEQLIQLSAHVQGCWRRRLTGVFRLSVPVFSNDPTSDDTQQATRRLAPGSRSCSWSLPGGPTAPRAQARARPPARHSAHNGPCAPQRAARSVRCPWRPRAQDRPQRARAAPPPAATAASACIKTGQGHTTGTRGRDKGTTGAAQGHPAPNLPNRPPPRTAYREPSPEPTGRQPARHDAARQHRRGQHAEEGDEHEPQQRQRQAERASPAPSTFTDLHLEVLGLL